MIRRSRSAALVGAAVVLAVIPAVAVLPSAGASPGSVVAQPSSPTGSENNDYPRIIRLANSADAAQRGTLLVMYSVNDTGVRTHSVIKRSTDNGASWSTLSTLYSPTAGWGIYFGSMYELPQASGGLPAGTIIAAGNAWDNVNWSNQEVQTFVSTDYGVSWQRRGNCITKSGAPNQVSTGLWEPEIILNADGKLACHVSDERLRASGYSQKLVMVTSADGGTSWGNQIDTVAIGDSSSRPGMPIVRKLPNGSYAMAFELCRDSVGNADQTCRVYLKKSADGANWGSATALGSLVQTADGRQLLHTPALTVSTAGGPNGTLVMSGQRVVTGSDGATTAVVPESGRTVFVNTALGDGAWQAVSAPVTIDPTGDYNNGAGKHCANYSPSLVTTASGTAVMIVTPRFVSGSSTRCDVRFGVGPTGTTLPLYAPFDSGTDTGWATFGGSWSVSGGVYSQSGTSAGPKALVGSTGWTDVTVRGDVRIGSAGQAGYLVRTRAPGIGADAHTGYYVGIETNGTLIVGRQNNSWTSLAVQSVGGGIAAGTWYHLQATVVGCTITARVKSETATAFTTVSATDPGCFASGQVGVRTHLVSADFKNISVLPAGGSTLPATSDAWAAGTSTGWAGYGGSFATVASGGVERQTATGADGPKLISPASGTAATVLSDVRIDTLSAPGGNAGVLARVTSPAVGADSYTGYYAGVDGSAGTLAVGRAANSWVPLGSIAVPGGVQTGGWYHVTLRAAGCQLTATAQATSSWDQAVYTGNDSGCPASGSAGIRSWNAAASWREFSAVPG